MTSTDSPDDNADYTALGLSSRDRFVAKISAMARDGISGKRMTSGSARIVDESISRLVSAGVASTLPQDRPVQLDDLVKVGAISRRLGNCLENEGEEFFQTKVSDFGAQQYLFLKKSPNLGITSLVELATVIEAYRETNGFGTNPVSQQKLSPAQPESVASANWLALAEDERQRAIGRLVVRLGDPKFAAMIMPVFLEIETLENKLGLASPATKKPGGPTNQ